MDDPYTGNSHWTLPGLDNDTLICKLRYSD